VEFDASVLCCEVPLDAGGGCVSGVLPGLHLLLEVVFAAPALFEALTRKHTQFQFRHVEPAGVLGGEVPLDALAHTAGIFGSNRRPSECGLRLPHPPRKPRYVPYISFPRFVSAVRRPEWREFLEGYGKGLES